MLGLGNDILEIGRIRDVLEKQGDRFMDRVFTPREQEYCLKHSDPAPYFAVRFSAKEAVVKALGCGFGKITCLDIEIVHDAHGKPEVVFSDKVNELFHHPKVFLSLSHCKEYVSTVAIWIK